MMQGWLRLWGQPTEAGARALHGVDGDARAGDAGDGHPRRPRALPVADGPALDVAFLQLMLRHHRGGLSMMQEEAARGSVPVVASLARSMVASQTAEADTMTQMLAQRGAAPLPL